MNFTFARRAQGGSDPELNAILAGPPPGVQHAPI